MALIALTEANFDEEVKQSSLPVLVSFQPNSGSTVDGVSERMGGVLKCCTINPDTELGLAKKYRVRSLPTFLLFNGGRVTDTIVGTMGAERLMRILQ
ncbi:MAG: thioredoxin family protein [Oscillospiraceae bacterium]|nr:thioredoxin family protein [Oscillospiraceae bacterium]